MPLWNQTVDQHSGPTNAAVPSYAHVVGAINRVCDPTDLALTAAGGLPGELCKNWKAKSVGSFDCEFGFSCMGYEIAGGWGAKMADPGRDVIVFTGDGSYLMLNSDIYSSVLTGHKLIVVLCDNGGFAVINRLQNGKGSASFNNLIKDCRIERAVTVDFAQARRIDGGAGRARHLDRRARGRVPARQGGRSHLRHRDRRRRPPMDAGRCLVGRRRARGQPAQAGAGGARCARRRPAQAADRGLSMAAPAAGGKGPIRLGIAPIGWSNDDLPELGGDIPLEQCLREARQAGYAGVEKGGKFPLEPQTLGPLLAEHDLALITGWFSGELRHGTVETEKTRIAPQLRLFNELGAPVMVYAETTGTVQNRIEVPVAERPRMPHEEFKRYGEKLTALAEWLRAEGCPMSFHHHMGTVVETEEEVDWLIANSGDAVGLLFDTGHLTFAGGRIPDTIRRHGRRINHVHCKDIRPAVLARLRAENWSFLKGVIEGVFTVPGDGSIDFSAVAQLLAEIGYAGWVVVEAEQDPKKANPLEMAQIGHKALTGAFTAAGFELSA